MNSTQKHILEMLADLTSVGSKADAASVPILQSLYLEMFNLDGRAHSGLVNEVWDYLELFLNDLQQGKYSFQSLGATSDGCQRQSTMGLYQF